MENIVIKSKILLISHQKWINNYLSSIEFIESKKYESSMFKQLFFILKCKILIGKNYEDIGVLEKLKNNQILYLIKLEEVYSHFLNKKFIKF